MPCHGPRADRRASPQPAWCAVRPLPRRHTPAPGDRPGRWTFGTGRGGGQPPSVLGMTGETPERTERTQPTEPAEPTTVVRLPRGATLLLALSGPLLGAVSGGLPVLLAGWRAPWGVLAGLAVGVGLAVAALLAVLSCPAVTLTGSSVRVARHLTRRRARVIARRDLAAVFLDGRRLVMLDRASRQLVSVTTRARARDLARAFRAHGYPWTRQDPHEGLYRRWVPGTAELPAAVNAALGVREVALRRRLGRAAAELREEVQKLGFVVRDRASRQYWRPLVSRSVSPPSGP